MRSGEFVRREVAKSAQVLGLTLHGLVRVVRVLEVVLQIHGVVVTDRARARIFLDYASFCGVIRKDVTSGGELAMARLLGHSQALVIVAFVDEDVAYLENQDKISINRDTQTDIL